MVFRPQSPLARMLPSGLKATGALACKVVIFFLFVRSHKSIESMPALANSFPSGLIAMEYDLLTSPLKGSTGAPDGTSHILIPLEKPSGSALPQARIFPLGLNLTERG